MAFLTDKFKGIYKIRTEYDSFTNQFPRDLNGNYSDYDLFIDCSNGIRVFYFGYRGNIEAYIPSIGRGRNIIKAIYSDFIKPIEDSEYMEVIEREKDGEITTTNSFNYEALYKDEELNKFIHTVIETDEELTFKFKWNLMEQFEKYLKPKTSAANRSPFSSKNLPKCEYIIPEKDMNKYKEVTSKLPKEDALKLGHMTNDYIKTLATKKHKFEDIKSEMKQKCLRSKEYIHSIGHWISYLEFLDRKIGDLS